MPEKQVFRYKHFWKTELQNQRLATGIRSAALLHLGINELVTHVPREMRPTGTALSLRIFGTCNCDTDADEGFKSGI